MPAAKAPYPSALDTSVSNPRLRLLNKLQSGQYPLMTFLALPSVRHAQIVALCNFDAIIIDCEHGNIGDSDMHNAVAAIAALGVSPVIRIRGPAHDIIKRALDTGAHGIMVPQINNAEEARQIVASSKFPPQGVRGQGSAFPAIAHGLTTPEYMQSANETLITMIQIETKAGVENVEEICATPGVDMAFIGPNDLAQSLLGYVPAKGNEEVFVSACEKIVDAARRNGKWSGRMVNNGSVAKDCRKTYDTVAITGMLMSFWRACSPSQGTYDIGPRLGVRSDSRALRLVFRGLNIPLPQDNADPSPPLNPIDLFSIGRG